MSGTQSARRVFISYSSKDIDAAKAILNTLEKRGISCWFAPRDIPGGANWMGEISRAIQRSSVMVLIWSRNANSSDDMKREAALAGREKKRIIGVRIDNSSFDDDWSYDFAVRHFLNASSGIDRISGVLVAQVQAASGRRAPLPPEPPSDRLSLIPPRPLLAPPIRKFSIAVAVAAVVTVITASFFHSSTPLPDLKPKPVDFNPPPAVHPTTNSCYVSSYPGQLDRCK